MTDAERAAWGRHFERLRRLLAEGVLILAGPTLGETNTGVAVFATGELRAFRLALLRGRD